MERLISLDSWLKTSKTIFKIDACLLFITHEFLSYKIGLILMGVPIRTLIFMALLQRASKVAWVVV